MQVYFDEIKETIKILNGLYRAFSALTLLGSRRASGL